MSAPSSLWRLIRRARTLRAPLAFALLLGCGVAATSQAVPLLQRLIIDQHLVHALRGGTGAAPALSLWWLGGGYLALALTEVLVRVGFQRTIAWSAQRATSELRAELFAKLLSLPLSYFDRTPTGRLVTQITSDAEAAGQLVRTCVGAIIEASLMLVCAAAFMLLLSPRLALLTAAGIPVLYLIVRFFQGRFRQAYGEVRREEAALGGELHEAVVGMSTLQLFSREKAAIQRFSAHNQALLGANLVAIRWFSLFLPSAGLVSLALLTLVLWDGGNSVLAGALTVGTLFAFTQYTRNFLQPLQDLSNVSSSLQAGLAAADRAFALLDEPQPLPDPERPLPLDDFRGEVELEDVWFAHREEDWVLRGVSLHVPAGAKVAIVGATGAGKSTLVSLLSRLYDPQRGRVRVDGQDVRAYGQRDLRRRIGVVQQEPWLFAGSIADNVRLSDPSVPLERVVEACVEVGLDGFIRALPQGYDTPVAERGANLSTGQKQLLAFARVLTLHRRSLLVLDEATASLDAESEERLQRAQERVMRGRTSIVIAHRLSTVVRCDEILVMDRGQVVERGTHAALLRQDGLYARLCALQLQAPAA